MNKFYRYLKIVLKGGGKCTNCNRVVKKIRPYGDNSWVCNRCYWFKSKTSL